MHITLSSITPPLSGFLTLPHELEEGLRNDSPIVGNGSALHGILVDLVVEDAGGMAVEEHLGDDLPCELGVALDGDVFAWLVHALHLTDVVGA